MRLESTIILMDNSEYQRNGDYSPTRLIAQKDGINFVCQVKLRNNPENDVGLLTCSAPCQVLCTLMTDGGHVLTKLHGVNPLGNLNLKTAISIAHLALKHRHGKNHKMRIVAFVGSPLVLKNTQELHVLAKRLKKEKVCVDIVSFGEHKENVPLLNDFVETLNGRGERSERGSSNLLVLPRGADFVQALMQSPIIREEGEASNANFSPDAFAFGFDPETDPELAFALRISMEEDRLRQVQEVQLNSQANAFITSTDAPSLDEVNLQSALGTVPLNTQLNSISFPDFNDINEDEQIAYAMRLSMDDFNEDIPQENENVSNLTSSTENNTETTELDENASTENKNNPKSSNKKKN